MATFLNNKVGFKVNSVNLSDHVTAFTLNRVLDQIEISAMGDTAHKYTTGLSADTITVSFVNDDLASGAGSVRATLQAAFGTTVAFQAIQDTASAVSGTNPLYSGTTGTSGTSATNGGSSSTQYIPIMPVFDTR